MHQVIILRAFELLSHKLTMSAKVCPTVGGCHGWRELPEHGGQLRLSSRLGHRGAHCLGIAGGERRAPVTRLLGADGRGGAAGSHLTRRCTQTMYGWLHGEHPKKLRPEEGAHQLHVWEAIDSASLSWMERVFSNVIE